MARYAQDAPFWETPATEAKSTAEIQSFLRKKLKADEVVCAWSDAKQTLLVSFTWEKQYYQITYKPLKSRTWGTASLVKAIRQMYRRALNHLKVLVDLTLDGHTEAMTPYIPMLGQGGITIQQAGISGLENMLRNPELLALPAPEPDLKDDIIDLN